ncbi:MAG TPA: response regulator [Desulfuromonadaceae bacterium]
MKTRDILVVDDDIHYLRLFSMCLEYEGFDVCAASGGNEALEMLEQETFRMMITDFNMPEINGVELASKVREQCSDMRVVIVTASNISNIVEAAIRAGISGIFSKPLDMEKLLDVIRFSLSPGQKACA